MGTGDMFWAVDTIASKVIEWVTYLATSDLGMIIAFFVAISLLFWIVGWVKRAR